MVDEHAVTLGFHQWLASVTERIHLTMHYQNNGTARFTLVQHFSLFWIGVCETLKKTLNRL